MGRSWVVLALLCACAAPRGPGTPRRLSVDRGEARAAPVTPALAGVDAPDAPQRRGAVKLPPSAGAAKLGGLDAASPSERQAPPPSERMQAGDAGQPPDSQKAAPEEKTQRHDGEASAPAPDAAGAAAAPPGGAAPPPAGGSPPKGAGSTLGGPLASPRGGGPSAGMRTAPKGLEQDLPAMSDAKGGQVDKLLENRLDVTAYRVQISKTRDFEKPLFDKTFDVMKPIDLFAEFEDAGVVIDQNAYWVRIALIDLLDREEKFTAPRLYGLDKKRKED